MNITDIADWKNCSSVTKINKLNPRPYLREVSEILFTKGKFSFSYRTYANDVFVEADILQKKL